MSFKFENELRLKAKEWIDFIANSGLIAEVPFNGFRDYQVKISIQREGHLFGNLNLYFNPTKQSYSLKAHELRDSTICPEIEVLWVNFITGNEKIELPLKDYEAYVDGSYIEGKIGYGGLVLFEGKIIAELSGPVAREDLLSMRQIGGELYSVINLIEWAQENSIREIYINYDYAGIEMWANGQWKAQQAFVIEYIKVVKECKINIHWQKVKGHSGNPWNERADHLAKKGALGSKTDTQKNNNIEVIIDKMQQFIEMANNRGIQAANKGTINNQFGRITFSSNGVLDLYNSNKRSWKTPYIHDFNDSQLEAKVKELWQEFTQNQGPHPQENPFYEVDYYLKILRPYRECRFDFIGLAEALNRVVIGLGQPKLDVQLLRFDYFNLENVYEQIKENYRAH